MPELLHQGDLRRIHARRVEEVTKATEQMTPKQGFEYLGLCSNCIMDHSRDMLNVAAREIGLPPPTDPAAVPLAMQVYVYGIMLGREMAKERGR